MDEENLTVSIELKVERDKNGVATPFCSNVLTYHEMTREGLVMIEQKLVDLLQGLVDEGKARLKA